MSKFEIGDRVEFLENYDAVRRGARGEITDREKSIDPDDGGLFSVKLDDGGHTSVFGRRLRHIEAVAARANILPEDDDARAAILLATCLLDYFPNACAAIAAHSAKSNAKHNPGQPPHWARDKSTGHRDKIVRHLVDAGGFDKDGNRHSTALGWRALANLEDELIAEGATPGRNAKGSPDALTNRQHNCIEDEV